MPGIRRGATPDRVLQILEADGGWFTVDALIAEYEHRWGPPPAAETLRRAIYRLIDDHGADLEIRYLEAVRYQRRDTLRSRRYDVGGPGEEYPSVVRIAQFRSA